MKSGGRVKRMGGGMSTKRKDMRSGYYENDMGMKGGPMMKKGGRVGKKKQGYKDRKDESIAMRIKKKRTKKSHSMNDLDNKILKICSYIEYTFVGAFLPFKVISPLRSDFANNSSSRAV